MPAANATNGIMSGSRNFPTQGKCRRNVLNLTQAAFGVSEKLKVDWLAHAAYAGDGMADIRKRPEATKKEARLKELRDKLRQGLYRVDGPRLIEAFVRATKLSEVERFQ